MIIVIELSDKKMWLLEKWVDVYFLTSDHFRNSKI